MSALTIGITGPTGAGKTTVLNVLRELDAVVLGVSKDSTASHCKFRDKYGLRFPLLTDAEHRVMDAWGAWGEKVSYGRPSIGVLRSTFLVDEQGFALAPADPKPGGRGVLTISPDRH